MVPPTLSEALASEIRAELAKQGLPINDLVARLGRSRTTVRASLQGKRPFDLDELAVVAEFFNLRPHILVDRAAATMEAAA